MKIKIRAVSDSDKHFSSAILEYTRRLSNTVELTNLKPTKGDSQELIIHKDTEAIIEKINKSDEKRILLSKTGQSLDTLSRSKKIVYPGSKINFIIGGPYGLDEERLKSHIHQRLSFGKMTYPHGLAKLILLEQIYRAQTIHSGKKYHY